MIRDSKILIRQPFSEQYTLTIQSELDGVDVFITSEVQLRYDFHVLRVDDKQLEIRLVQLDNVLLEANNPMVREVAQVSQLFGRMYNELHLLLDHSGKVIDVLNNAFILSKWKQTKAEMDKHIAANDDLKNAIILNDNIFTDPEKIKIAVQANEFLRIYFGQVYNKDLPKRETVKGTNIFNTENMEWRLNISSSVSLPASAAVQSVTIKTIADPGVAIDRSFIKSAYSHFANKIELKELKPKLGQFETRIIAYQTGRLQEAEVEKLEIADEKKLYSKLRYILESDGGISLKENDNQTDNAEALQSPKEEGPREYRFF